jgi:hypothetical protein
VVIVHAEPEYQALPAHEFPGKLSVLQKILHPVAAALDLDVGELDIGYSALTR